MKVAEVVRIDGCQLVKLPEGFQLEGDTVSIRRQGESLVLQPIKSAKWPLGFFDRIRIDDPAFRVRPKGAFRPPRNWSDRCPYVICSTKRLPGSANAAQRSSAKWSSTKIHIGFATSEAAKEFSSGSPKSSGSRLPGEFLRQMDETAQVARLWCLAEWPLHLIAQTILDTQDDAGDIELSREVLAKMLEDFDSIGDEEVAGRCIA